MGTSDSKKAIEQEFQIIKVQGNGNTLLKSKIDQKEYLMRTISSSNKVDIGRIKSLLQCRAMLKNHHLLSLVEIKEKEKENMCSKHYNLYLVLEYSLKSMGQEMIERCSQPQKSYFNESELWSIIYSCCTALNALYSNGATHQSISYSNIYINNDGYIKMAEPMLFGLQKNYIQILNNKEKLVDNKQMQQVNLHLSPEIVGCLDQQNFEYYDRQKSDIFILAMVIVDLSLLKYNHLFYTKEQLRYLQAIPQLMKKLEPRYSNKLIHLLQKMLRIEANQRLNINQVIEIIQSYNNNGEESILAEAFKRNSPNKNRNSIPIAETVHESHYVVKESIRPQSKTQHHQAKPKESRNIDQYDISKKTQPILPAHTYQNQSLVHYQTSLSIKEGHSQLNNQNFDGRVFHSTNQTHQSHLHSNYGLYSTVKNPEPFYNQRNYFNDIRMTKNNHQNTNILYDNSRSIQSSKVSENNDSQNEHQKQEKVTIEKKMNHTFAHHHHQVVNTHSFTGRMINNTQMNNVSNQHYQQPRATKELNTIIYSNNKIENHVASNQLPTNQSIKKDSPPRQLNNSYEKRFSSPNKPTIILKYINNEVNTQDKLVNSSLNSQRAVANHVSHSLNTANQFIRPSSSSFSGLNVSANTPLNQQIKRHPNEINSARQNISNFEVTPKSEIKNIKDKFISQIRSNNGQGHLTYVNNSVTPPQNTLSFQQPMNKFQQVHISQNGFKKLNMEKEIQQVTAHQGITSQINGTIQKNYSFSPFQKDDQPIELSKTKKVQNKVIFTHEIPEVYNIMKNNSKAPINTEFFTKQEKKIILDHNHASTPQHQENMASVNRFTNFSNYPKQTISQFAQSHTSIYSPNFKPSKQESSIKRQGQKHIIRQAVSRQYKTQVKAPYNKQSSIKLYAPVVEPGIVISSKEQVTFNHISNLSNKSIAPNNNIIKAETYLEHQPMDYNNPKLEVQASSLNNRKLQYIVEEIEDKGRYQGYKFENKKTGQGILYFKDGGYYNGEWKDDRMEGYGKLYYENGTIAYEGSWKNDEFNGKGRVYNSQPTPFQGEFDFNDFSDLQNKWIYYDGQFKNDEKNGKGYIKLGNGQMFQGLFDHDMIQGNGIFYKSSGQIVVGYWINNRLFLNQSFSYQSKKPL